MKIKIMSLILLIFLSACAKEKTYTVEELVEDQNLFLKVYQHCQQASMNEQMNSANCTRVGLALKVFKIREANQHSCDAGRQLKSAKLIKLYCRD